MKSVQRRPSSYVRTPLGEARIERMWAAIAEREARPPGRLQKRTLGLLLVAAAIALIFVSNSLRRRSPLQVKPDTLEGWAFETGTVKLPDGTTLEIAEGSRLTVGTADEHAVRLRLVRGRVTCEVATARRVLLAAGSFELDSRDARFSVERSLSGALNVRVDRGTVELRDPTRTVATLSAGQSWSESPIAITPPSASTALPAATTPPPVPSVAKTAAPQPSVAKEIDPATLFALGDEARLAGKHAEAAGYFDRLRTHHRDDPRAGLAAYQLGRIRLGSLHDPAGAASAFADAIVLSKDAPFRDDAEVGRIEALDEAGELEACRTARIAFVEAHPTSPLLSRANKRCP